MKKIIFQISFMLIFVFSRAYCEDWKDLYLASQKYANSEKYSEAYESAVEAVAKSKNVFFNEKNLDYALCLCNLGGICLVLEKLSEAEDCYKRAELIYEKVNGGVDPAVGTTDAALGDVYLSRGDYASSVSYFTKAVEIYEKNKVAPEWIARVYMGLALAYKNSGELMKAKNQFLKLIDFQGSKNYLSYELNARVFDSMSDLFCQLKQFNDSVYYEKKALKIFRSKGNRPEVFVSLVNLGIRYYDSKKNKLAEATLKEAVSEYESESLSNVEVYSGALMMLAEICYSRNDFRGTTNYCIKALDTKVGQKNLSDSEWRSFLNSAENICERMGTENDDEVLRDKIDELRKKELKR